MSTDTINLSGQVSVQGTAFMLQSGN